MILYSTESAIFALGREGIPFQWNTKVTFHAKGKGDPLGRPHPLKLCRIIVSALWF
jgi:hypothetical protein